MKVILKFPMPDHHPKAAFEYLTGYGYIADVDPVLDVVTYELGDLAGHTTRSCRRGGQDRCVMPRNDRSATRSPRSVCRNYRRQGWEWPRTFEEIAAWVEAGRDIGWHAEQFLVDEVRRLRSV